MTAQQKNSSICANLLKWVCYEMCDLSPRCVIVGSLQVAYRLPTALGITISQPQPRAAALQDSDLYVEVDKLDSYTHILPELTRMFASGAVQPQLAQFLIALTLTMVSHES